jgi:hypothetical protein
MCKQWLCKQWHINIGGVTTALFRFAAVQVACRDVGYVAGETVSGAGALQTFPRAVMDIRCSSTDTRLSQCPGVYSLAPRTCYSVRVICHTHELGGCHRCEIYMMTH